MAKVKQPDTPIIGVSKNVIRIKDLISHVADAELNTIITGETGVGKELIAQNLYQLSPRLGKPFIKINCAALPESLLESELYGYERGAFTGADRKKKGKFELANGGVLFLDEIGDMPLSLQSKLLHVLQSGEFSPLGSESDIQSDAWVITATNQELEKSIQRNLFREDLFYRLNTINIHILPLRQRPEDIPELIHYYLGAYKDRFQKNRINEPSADIMSKLTAYSWPGNVRELQNILKKLLVLGDWNELTAELELRSSLQNPEKQDKPLNAPKPNSMADMIDLDLVNSMKKSSFSLKTIKKTASDQIEKEVIAYVLEQTHWNRTKAAKILKISYKTLLYKISDLNINSPAGH